MFNTHGGVERSAVDGLTSHLLFETGRGPSFSISCLGRVLGCTGAADRSHNDDMDRGLLAGQGDCRSGKKRRRYCCEMPTKGEEAGGVAGCSNITAFDRQN